MKRFFAITVTVLLGGLGLASDANAQVIVRAPFVRVYVDGPNVQVRAPFVRYGSPTYIYGSPMPLYVLPPPRLDGPDTPAPPEFTPPPPKQAAKPAVDADQTPPQPVKPGKAPTLTEFANAFAAKAGSYEVTLLNPVTKEPTTVRFILPEGTPRRIQVRENQLEFNYGLRRFVRIEFDNEGAQVVSR
ncbi:MAG: hypothetical protein HY040_28270 [Planctomycetes bacterium]|nr:hypothetical protein [Planctomycetota bacterium]